MLRSIFAALALALVSLPSLSVAAVPDSYAVWAADSAIARKQGNGYRDGSPYVSYEHGELWYAFEQLYKITGDKKYFNYILAGANVLVDSAGKIISQYK